MIKIGIEKKLNGNYGFEGSFSKLSGEKHSSKHGAVKKSGCGGK
jgi:hypothetical protein